MPSAWSWRRTWGRGSGRSPHPGGRSRATGRSSPTLGAAGWRSSFPWGGCCTCRNHRACRRFGLRRPRPLRRGRLQRQRPIKPPPKRSPPPQYGGYANIRYVLQHFRGDLATEQRRSKVINVCPWSRLDGVGHCSWKAGKQCRPAHLHPRDLLDHLQRDHGADPAPRDPAMAMLAGIMPGGQAGPFTSAQARSRALALPTGACPAGGQGASQSAAQPGAVGSAARCGATTSTGSAEASTSSGGAAGEPAAPAGSKPAAATSSGDPRGQGLASRPHRALVVPLRPMIQIRRGALIHRRSREGAPPPTPGQRCPGTCRA